MDFDLEVIGTVVVGLAGGGSIVGWLGRRIIAVYDKRLDSHATELGHLKTKVTILVTEMRSVKDQLNPERTKTQTLET